MIPFAVRAKNSIWRMNKGKVELLHSSSLNVLSNTLFLSSKLRSCVLVCRLALERKAGQKAGLSHQLPQRKGQDFSKHFVTAAFAGVLNSTN